MMKKMIFTVSCLLAGAGCLLAQDSVVITPRRDLLADFMTQQQEMNMNMVQQGVDEAMATGRVAIVSTMVVIALIVLGYFVYRFLLVSRLNKSRYELIQTAMREGREIPEDLFRPSRTENRTYLTRGVLWCAVGLGCAVGLAFIGPELAAFALIPILVGVGFLIIFRVNKKEENRAEGQPYPNDEQQ